MMYRVNQYLIDNETRPLCDVCMQVTPAYWADVGSPSCVCSRCGAAQHRYPELTATQWRDYYRRAFGNGSTEQLLARAYGQGWADLFNELATSLANGWALAD